MQTYLLFNPTALELELLQRISGSKKKYAIWKTFPSGEVHVKVKGVGERVCVIARTHPPADHIVQTLLLLDTLRHEGAKDITLVLPYFAYGRQDRQREKGEALSARCITNLLASAGASRIVTVDIHSKRVVEGSPIPIIDVNMIQEQAGYMRRELKREDYTVVAADRGGKERAQQFAKALHPKNESCWIEKERDLKGKVRARSLEGKIKGKTALLIDDMLDTGGTIKEAVILLRKKGLKHFYLSITHPIFSKGASTLVRSLKFGKIFVSDTLPLSQEVRNIPGLTVVKTGKPLAFFVEKG